MSSLITSINRTATFSWCPIPADDDGQILVCTGSVSGALDASFSSQSKLELFGQAQTEYTASSNDGNSSSQKVNFQSLACVESQARFNRLAWSRPVSSASLGIIAAGLEDGCLELWDANRLMNCTSSSSADDALIARKLQIHSGPVRGLDFNRFQHNLLATGSCQAEVYIWDMNNPQKPYSPGPKSSRLSDVLCLGWNSQVQHILATGASNGMCVIWDLKNRREIIQLQHQPSSSTQQQQQQQQQLVNQTHPSNALSRISSVCWHPNISTQLITASGDDWDPSMYMWDLRNASRPIRSFSNAHRMGILCVDWCSHDPDLLLSTGKDGVCFLWNPQTGELLGEPFGADNNHLNSRSSSFSAAATTFQQQPPEDFFSNLDPSKTGASSLSQTQPPGTSWGFETRWCPHQPNLLANARFDGQIRMHSLMSVGGDSSAKPDADDSSIEANFAQNLKKQPPKWLRRVCGASFGFGNRLLLLSSLVSAQGQKLNDQHNQSSFKLIQVHPYTGDSHVNLVKRTQSLFDLLCGGNDDDDDDNSGKIAEFCKFNTRALNTKTQTPASSRISAEIWPVLKALCFENSREELVELLGFSASSLIEELEANGVVLERAAEDDHVNISQTFDAITANQNNINENMDNGSDNPQTPKQSTITDADSSQQQSLFGGGSGNNTHPSSPPLMSQSNQEQADEFDFAINGSAFSNNIINQDRQTLTTTTTTAGSLDRQTVPYSHPPSESTSPLIQSKNNPGTLSIKPLPSNLDQSIIDEWIFKAIISAQFSLAIDLCLRSAISGGEAGDRLADGLAIGCLGGEEALLRARTGFFQIRLGRRHHHDDEGLSRAATTNKLAGSGNLNVRKYLALVDHLLRRDWQAIISANYTGSDSQQQWKQKLALILTFSEPNQVGQLCRQLGEQQLLAGSSAHRSSSTTSAATFTADMQLNAQLAACWCFLIAGDVGKLIELMKPFWFTASLKSNSPQYQQVLVEFMEWALVFDYLAKASTADDASLGRLSLPNWLSRDYCEFLVSHGLLNLAKQFIEKFVSLKLADEKNSSLAVDDWELWVLAHKVEIATGGGGRGLIGRNPFEPLIQPKSSPGSVKPVSRNAAPFNQQPNTATNVGNNFAVSKTQNLMHQHKPPPNHHHHHHPTSHNQQYGAATQQPQQFNYGYGGGGLYGAGNASYYGGMSHNTTTAQATQQQPTAPPTPAHPPPTTANPQPQPTPPPPSAPPTSNAIPAQAPVSSSSPSSFQQPQQPTRSFVPQPPAPIIANSPMSTTIGPNGMNGGNFGGSSGMMTSTTMMTPAPYSTGPGDFQMQQQQQQQPSMSTQQTVPPSMQKPVGGFNDPPADIFKSTKPKHRAAPLTPAQPQQSAIPTPTMPSSAPAGAYQQQQQRQQQPLPNNAQQHPPNTSPPAAQQQQRLPSPQPQQAAKNQLHPTGDRSHIPAHLKPIHEVLLRTLNTCKPLVPPAQKKMLADVERRFNLLFDRLNNNQVSEPACSLLLQFTQALQAKKWNDAISIQQNLLTQHSSQGTNWILGLKRLVEICSRI